MGGNCRSLSALLEQLVANMQEHEQLSSGHRKDIAVTHGLISEGYNSEKVLEIIKENFVKTNNNNKSTPLQSSPNRNTKNAV